MNALERAQKAAAILESPVFTEAFESVRTAIIDRLEKCPLNAAQEADELRKCLRLLRDVRLNLVAVIGNGKVAGFRLEQDEQRKKNPLRFFYR